MLKTLKDARESSLANVTGACSNTAQFRQALNDATERLLKRGDWPGTVIPIQLCAYSGCIVWPRYVGEVRKLNICRRNAPIKNLWYDFIPYDGAWSSCWSSWAGARVSTVTEQGRTPVFQDIQGEGRTVRAYIQRNEDLGKTIRIFGTDNNGQTLHEPDGSEGILITFEKPFGSTNTFVRHIDRVLKDETVAPVALYAYNATTNLLEDLAYYEPSETNPSYVREKLAKSCCGSSAANCLGLFSLVALIKVAFIPVKVDTDLVLIEDLPALKEMIEANKLADAHDYANAQIAEARAIRELNLALWNRDQDDKVPVNVNVFSNTGVGAQKCY